MLRYTTFKKTNNGRQLNFRTCRCFSTSLSVEAVEGAGGPVDGSWSFKCFSQGVNCWKPSSDKPHVQVSVEGKQFTPVFLRIDIASDSK